MPTSRYPFEAPFIRRFLRAAPNAALASRLAAAAACGLVLCAAVAVQARAAEAVQNLPHYRIPAGELASALRELASAANLLLTFNEAQVRGRTTRGLDGAYGPQTALDVLLAGTGLRAERLRTGGYVLRETPAEPGASLLPSVTVLGEDGPESATGPVHGYVARRSATGSKTDTPLIETPQTLTVISREQMELQGVATVTQALQYAPGALASFGGTNSQYDVVQARGFYPRDYLDGLRLPFSEYSVAVPQFDPYMLERIELLQGPASVLFGQSSPGGILNMVSRRPQAEAAHEIVLQGGNFDRRQIAFDTTGPVDEDGQLLYRLTGLLRRNDGQIDHSDEARELIAPAFTWRPSAQTSFTLLTHYQHDEMLPQYQSLPAAGTLYPNPNGELPRRRLPGDPSWDKLERSQYGIGYALEHAQGEKLKFRQNLRYTDVDVDTRSLPAAALLPDNRTVVRVATASKAQGSIFSVDNQAEAKFDTGALNHTLLFGIDYMRQRDDYRFSNSAPTLFMFDLYDPVYGIAVPELNTTLSTLQKMNQAGFYLQDQIRTGGWVFTLGGRYDRAEADTSNRRTGTTVSRTDTAFTGRVGVNYVFDNGIAPYASYSTSFEPLMGTTFAGAPFEPTRGKQWEAGIRYQPAGGKTLLALAVYRLTQTNRLTPDTDPTHVGFSVQEGEAVVKGVTVEARTQPLRNVDLIANYAYTHSEVTKANTEQTGASLRGQPLSRTPKHVASLWLAYNFTHGPLDGLTVGMGARHLGSNYSDTAMAIKLPSLTLLDMAVHYDLSRMTPAMKGWKLSLSASNLADKKYVSYCLSAMQCFWGQERTAMVTLRKTW